jgi:hypothetical protein
MFLNLKYADDINVERMANIYKFQDTLKTIIPQWDNKWQYLDSSCKGEIIFYNFNFCRLIFKLNEDFQTFNLKFEFDKYLASELSIQKNNIDINEFCDIKNSKRFIGSLILELYAEALEQHLQSLKRKYQGSTVLG